VNEISAGTKVTMFIKGQPTCWQQMKSFSLQYCSQKIY